jgi:hypothetical protein
LVFSLANRVISILLGIPTNMESFENTEKKDDLVVKNSVSRNGLSSKGRYFGF